uniref:Putative ras gtpase effector rassf2 n=1 Tax=Anopheles braziliensis TaxID=58242 RepID=A0A2M3Z2F7_9DIPT
MWKCHKCGKPVFFAERKQSLGYDWHPECLRCEECGKRLNPGQHAEHKGVPYCHVPCYGALFGPQLFGHGTRVESHKSYGQPDQKKQAALRSPAGPCIPRNHLESRLRSYNQFHTNKSLEIRSREVNGRLVLEGALRIYWGVQGMIHLKEDDDQRTVVTVRKRNSYRQSNPVSLVDEKENIFPVAGTAALLASNERASTVTETNSSCNYTEPDSTNDTTTISESISYDTLSLSSELISIDSKPNSGESSKEASPCHGANNKFITLPSKLSEVKQLTWDEFDDLLQVERRLDDSEKLYRTMPSPMPARGADLESEGEASFASESVTTDTITDYKTLTPNVADSGDSSGGSVTLATNDSRSAIDDGTGGAEDAKRSTDITTTSNEGEDNFQTPEATLRSHDFEAFKRQINRDFLDGTADLKTTDGTLKLNQPIDPARINDSLKLYNDGVMQRSLSDEQTRNEHSPVGNAATIARRENMSMDRSKRYMENTSQKKAPIPSLSEAALSDGTAGSEACSTSTVTTDTDSWTADRGLLRSRSAGQPYSGNSFVDSDDDDVRCQRDDDEKDTDESIGVGSETIKPSVRTSNSIHIRMDCYDELESSRWSNRQAEPDCVARSSVPSVTSTVSSEYSATINDNAVTDDGVVLRKPPKTGSTAIKRRSGNRRSRTKLKRRCSINGHFYNRETSFFTPPYGSQMNVWVSSLVSTQEVINLLLEKYKVESKAENFALFVVRDNGEQKKLRDDDYPLVTRVVLGPHEDIARIFLMDGQQTPEISSEVAQFLNLSIPECRAILDRYHEEEQRELHRIRFRYAELRKRINQRMESLKVRL